MTALATEKEITKRHGFWSGVIGQIIKYAVVLTVGAGSATGVSAAYHAQSAPASVSLETVRAVIRDELKPWQERFERQEIAVAEAKVNALSAKSDSEAMKRRVDNDLAKLLNEQIEIGKSVVRIETLLEERTKKGSGT